MTDDDASLRHECLNRIGNAPKIRDAIVDDERLTLACELTLQCLLNSSLIPRNHLRHNCATIRRRRCQGRDIAQSEHRHVQRSRDRRRAECQDIRCDSKLKQALFVFNSEALLFIDHDEPEILESHILRKNAVRADEDVDIALRSRFENDALLSICLESTQRLHAERIRAESIAKTLLVLLGKHCGGHEQRSLSTTIHYLECRANRDFRFAESNVTAHEPIHRARPLHIALRGSDRSDLIFRFVVGKLRFEISLPL